MQFVAEYAIDLGSKAALEKHRDVHLTFWMTLRSLRPAMQILSDAGEMTGSIIILEADDQAQAEAMATSDPFVEAGVYSSLTVRPCQVRYCDLKAGPG